MSQALVKAQIVADETGLLRPRNIEEAFRLAEAYVQSGILPERYKTAASVLTAMQFALELGLKPLTALRQIAVVNGTPCLFGDLPLSICYASGKLQSIKEVYVDKNLKEICLANQNIGEQVFGALCLVKRQGVADIVESYFTMTEANQAGLLGSPTWKKYPKRMLRYRARAQALKDLFADYLNGSAIAEYDHNKTEDDIINATPSDSSNVDNSQASTGSDKENLADILKSKVQSNSNIIDAETVE